jgi:alpha-amylase
MSCFSKGSHGLLRVQTEPLSVLSEKNFVVSVKTRTTSSTSLYLVCRNGVTDPGSSVYAVGNVDMLGNWNPALALKLNPGPYPIWTAKVGNLPSNARVEWKCLKKHDQSGAVTEWQVGENNVKKSGRSQYSGESSGEF